MDDVVEDSGRRQEVDKWTSEDNPRTFSLILDNNAMGLVLCWTIR